MQTSDQTTEHIERHLRIMALVHPQSCECTKSELDLFGVPPTQISVEHGFWEQKGLTSTLTDQGPYEFVVSGAGEDYIDLANTHLFVEAHITKADGSALDVDSDVGTRQFMDALLIQRHKCQSQRKARFPFHQHVPVQNFLGNVAKIRTRRQRFATDRSRVVQRHTRIHGQQEKKENKGFGERLALIVESKLVQMMGKLHLDLFCQEKYLLNQVEMKIKLRRNRDVFALTGVTDTFKIKIKDISLFVRKVQLSPSIRMGHVKALEKTSSKYPIRRVEVKVDTVPRGNTNYDW